MNHRRSISVVLLLVLGLGIWLFHDGRARSDDPAFHLRKPPIAWARVLLAGVEQGDMGSARLAALALQQHGELTPDIVSVVEEALTKHARQPESWKSGWPAAEVLADLGPDGIPSLLRGLSPPFEVLSNNVESLGTRIYLPFDDASTVLALRLPSASTDPLLQTLQDEAAGIGERTAAATLLASVDVVTENRVLEALLRMFGDEDQPIPVQVFCQMAVFHAGTSWRLCRIASKTEDLAIRFPALLMAKVVGQALEPELAVVLRPLLSSEDAHVRLYAAALLLRSHCLMKQSRAILIGYLGADDPDLVARAADGLGLAGDSAAEAVPELTRLSEEMGPAGDEASLALRQIRFARGD